MNYVKPSLVNLGKSEELIQGSCGWGVENITLDATNAYWTTKRRSYLCGQTLYYDVWCCHYESACSTSTNQC